MRIYGYIITWKSIGYFEAYNYPGNYNVKNFTNSAPYHLDSVKFNGNNSYYKNATFIADNET